MIAYRWALVWTIRVATIAFVTLSAWGIYVHGGAVEVDLLTGWAGLALPVLTGAVGLAIAECLALLIQRQTGSG